MANTDLHLAAWLGDTGAIRASLIDKPEYLNAKDYLGRTPLHMAAYGGKISCAALLVRKGADVDARNHDGSTPLHLAAAMGEAGTCEFLVRAGANPDSKQHDGLTPMDWALQENLLEVAEVLLEHSREWSAVPLSEVPEDELAAGLSRERHLWCKVKEQS